MVSALSKLKVLSQQLATCAYAMAAKRLPQQAKVKSWEQC